MRTVVLVLAGALIGLLAAGLIWLGASPPRGEPVILHAPPTPRPLAVHELGEVMRPGVYELPEGSRVQAAIDAAGGFTLSANRSSVNLAALLDDGQQIDVPAEGEVRIIGNPALSPGETLAPGELININTADAAMLETLPAIGPALAQAIVDYRDANGDFETIEAIMDVQGIGQATFDAIRDLITVGP